MCADGVGHSFADVRTWVHHKHQVTSSFRVDTILFVLFACLYSFRFAWFHIVCIRLVLFGFTLLAFVSYCLVDFCLFSFRFVLFYNTSFHRDNMGRRLMRLVNKPSRLDKVFMPRGVTTKASKRPSPPVTLTVNLVILRILRIQLVLICIHFVHVHAFRLTATRGRSFVSRIHPATVTTTVPPATHCLPRCLPPSRVPCSIHKYL
jgi:hypothetical protein